MGKKKEQKPLVPPRRKESDKPSSGSDSEERNKSPKDKKVQGSSGKKAGKASGSRTNSRSKLDALREASNEMDEQGKGSSSKKCLDSSPTAAAAAEEGADANKEGPAPTTASDLEESKSCPIGFGVRSYLHHFYENVNLPKSASAGTEEDFFYLIHPKGRKCGAVWFKIGLIIGATLFLLGAVAIVIGYAIPRQDTVIGKNDDYEVVDKDAVRFNRNLDICKLIGLAGFCSGGLVLVISLLAPTFTSSYWEDDPATEPFRVSLSSSLVYESEPKSPIPVTEKINCIQPVWSD